MIVARLSNPGSTGFQPSGFEGEDQAGDAAGLAALDRGLQVSF
jgi:hypothetical protein